MRKPGKTKLAPILLCVTLALLAAGALRLWLLLPPRVMAFGLAVAQEGIDKVVAELPEGSLEGLLLAGSAFRALSAALLVCGTFWILASLLGLVFKRRWSLAFVRAGWFAVFLAAIVLGYVAFVAGDKLAAAIKEANPQAQDAVATFFFRWAYLRWALLASAVAAGMLVLSWRARTIAIYNPPPPPVELAAGDRVLENLRTGGQDPRFSKSLLSSLGLHWIIIVAVPFLWAMRGCVTPYLLPQGSGKPRVTRVIQVQKRKKKPRKKYILRPNAAVYWDIPDLNESKIAKEVEEETRLTYAANPNAVFGQMGAGGGNKGGWPEGVPGGKIRFIRLEYVGRDWDDGMDELSRADINFLAFLKKEVPFPVARRSEANRISVLKRYPKGFAPPFVYMTGSDNINTTSAEKRALREYLLDGGMLFADCGSHGWDYHFRIFIKSVFPD